MRLFEWLRSGNGGTKTVREPGEGGAASAAGGDALERRTVELGGELLHAARSQARGAASAGFWRDRLIDWAMRDPAFKAQLFRFVDAYPMLRTPAQVHDYLLDYLSQPGVTPPRGLGLGLRAAGQWQSALARTVESQVRTMAGRFIAGHDAQSALPLLAERWHEGMAFSVDLLGEACVSRAEAEAYQRRYIELIEYLSRHTADWSAHDRLERDHLDAIPRCNVSVKLTSLHAHIDPADFEGTVANLTAMVGPILESAAAHNVFINFDMEQQALKDLTLAVFERCCERFDFPAGIALQAYLRSGDADAQRIAAWARSTGRRVTVRLVKGAYWDYETIRAEQKGWPVPMWPQKAQTDACFERMTRTLLAATPRDAHSGGVTLALGSHNARSIGRALALLEQQALPASALELQMLYGMAEPMKRAALQRGLRLREYVPVGEMIPGMAYLVRRLLENTSNESWLKAGFAEDASDETLLASPHEHDQSPPETSVRVHGWQPERQALTPAVEGVGDGRPFLNEAGRDFSDPAQRRAFAEAIASARVPNVDQSASADDARRAVDAAQSGFATWRDTDPVERAALISRAADLMRQRRDELTGIVIRENGKTWRDADGDVCEAIDFCEYYARRSVELFWPRRLGRYVGEYDDQWHQPRGVAAVISPWNFPLAICCGMTSAALVTGNTVVVKPAEQTPGIARVMCELMWQAGVPHEALQYLPGQGETVGAALVRDPRVAVIGFTGSKAVGLNIVEAAGHTPDEQPFVKKVVCEMGGKNAMIVDSAADLDEAVIGVRDSAFQFAGQKCSACSRVIVLDDVHDTFVRRLVEATRALVIGDPLEPATDVSPVIDEDAAEKIHRYIEIGKQEGTCELAMDVPAGLSQDVGKPFVGPHIFSGIEPGHRLAQEEVFGPVLAVMRARDFEQALEIANGTAYKLTGGVYSRRPAHLKRAKEAFRVGNLYLNRGITGSLVGRQPFGGFGLSGVGSKSGGDEYLLQFVEPRSCAENTMRRGFAPET